MVGGTGQHGCELITASPSDLRRESCPCPPEWARPISQCGSPSLGHAGHGTAVIRRTCSGGPDPPFQSRSAQGLLVGVGIVVVVLVVVGLVGFGAHHL